MKLEDIAMFTEDGCLLTQNGRDMDIMRILRKRIEFLDTHIEQLERQIKLLETVLITAQDKRAFYSDCLKKQAFGGAYDA
jgi:chaperonin cofactor prefoldin